VTATTLYTAPPSDLDGWFVEPRPRTREEAEDRRAERNAHRAAVLLQERLDAPTRFGLCVPCAREGFEVKAPTGLCAECDDSVPAAVSL
jgi:hypothetical protein